MNCSLGLKTTSTTKIKKPKQTQTSLQDTSLSSEYLIFNLHLWPDPVNKKMDALYSYAKEIKKEEKKMNEGRFRKGLTDGPDLGVNGCLQKFTGLLSLENLKQHYESRKMELGDCAADWTKILDEKLAAFAKSPAWGLGALAIAVFIDGHSFSPPGENIKDALRCAFAGEKSSGVWDLIDECLKTCTMHTDNKIMMLNDIERIEGQLSGALTKLKISMLRDGHMSNQAVKVWVNGAAIHIQMLIHLVRLGGNQTVEPIKRLLSVYQRDLGPICEKHKEMVKGNLYSLYSSTLQNGDINHYLELGFMSSETFLEAYYSLSYGSLKQDTQKYFSDLRKDLPELVLQTGSFEIN